ncbi:MAG: polyphosphate:AMP phosphotransferase [Bacillota bacterium]|nr:polyphosphate:AMP phosphotransferase [Bacillota bacterium]
MLSELDLSQKIKKKEYEEIMADLRIKLGELQREAKLLNIPIMLVFEGWGASGKGTLINELILPLDPRGFNVYTTNYLNQDEMMRPFLWRFWVKTPAKGRIAIFEKSWYRRTLVERIDNDIEGNEIKSTFEDINSFERQLSDDGNIIMKFFIHISKEKQKERFLELESNPSTAWRVTKDDWKHHEQYEKYIKITEEMIEKTDKDYAPWTIIEGNDRKFAEVKVFTSIILNLENAINAAKEKAEAPSTSSILQNNTQCNGDNLVKSSILRNIDLSVSISKEEYKEKLKKYQNKMRVIEHELYTRRIPVVIVYEGWDAAGKGGNIKRITENLDPRGYQVVPIAAPNVVEKSHHYLWRFWNEFPKAGHITIFDRSWYGRVLVERVEGFCSYEEWNRAYKEINEMEEQFINFGAVVIKFWLQIDKDEQLARFNERMNTPEKQWKITDEDWRNREKWERYEDAANDMLIKTSTTRAPWTIIESNSKMYSRIKALKTVIDAIEKKI